VKKLIVIQGDYNDADYVYQVSILDLNDQWDVELLNLLPKISEAIKNCKHRHNWPSSEYCNKSFDELYSGILTEDEIGLFDEYCPGTGDSQIHSIVSIDVYDIADVKNFYKKA